jgi:hypothetical protein
MKDIYKNVIHDSRALTKVTITAIYENHNDWTSPITTPPPGVTDLANWEEIYGRDISGLAVFNNKSSDADSTYTGQVTIYRAGRFTLSILVNGIHIISSPLTVAPIDVSPAELYAPACIVNGLSLQMTAGAASTAQIQSRDFSSNNMKKLLAASV